VLSLGALSSPSGAAAYFIKGGEGQIADYYAEHQQSSQWGGGAKEVLGLGDGPVDFKKFEALLDGRISDTQTLGRMVKGERLRDPGRDFTFSAPKSVSLAAIGELEKPILEGFARSVATTMSWYEHNLAQAKVWDKTQDKQVKMGEQKILYATFMDFLSRANDPQLHIHTPFVNMAVGKDGKIRSLNYDLAYKHKILLGNIQRAELAKEMAALGLQIRPAGNNGLWELEGSSAELLMQFSKRRSQMIRQAPHKVEDAAGMAKIARITRPAKEKIDNSKIRERWTQEFKDSGTSITEYIKGLLDAPQRDKDGLTPKAAIDFAISHMSETEQHFDRLTLLRHAIVSTYSHVDIKSLEGELETRVQKGELLISEDERWLKPAKAEVLERKLVDELKKGHLKARVLSQHAFKDQNKSLAALNAGQKTAAKMTLTDKHRFIGIDGIAGSGKTFLLKHTLPALKDQGYEIIGLAPSHKALQGLTKSGTFDHTLTTQSFHKSPRGNSNTILVIDEAGMIGSEHFHAMMNFANAKNMPRVVFIGDPGQLPAIEAGRPFKHLLDNGLRCARMEENVRQKNLRHKKGVLELSNKDIQGAFQTLKKEIHEVTQEPLEDYALKLSGQMDNPAIIVNTNAQSKLINGAIKAAITARTDSGAGLKQRIWKPFHMSKAEKTMAGNYEGASHIRFTRDVGKDFKRGEIYKIEGVDHGQAKIMLNHNDVSKDYHPARHGSGDSFTRVYKQEVITLHVGDRIKFRQSDRKLGISNNDFGHIQSLKDGHVTISFDDERQTTLPATHRMLGHMDHGWANTAYSFQGATVKDNIVIMRADHNPLTTLASLYVGSSRHQDNLAIITDDKERLLNVISEKLEIENEIITFREPPIQQKIEENISREPDYEEHTQEFEHTQELEREMDIGMGM